MGRTLILKKLLKKCFKRSFYHTNITRLFTRFQVDSLDRISDLGDGESWCDCLEIRQMTLKPFLQTILEHCDSTIFISQFVLPNNLEEIHHENQHKCIFYWERNMYLLLNNMNVWHRGCLKSTPHSTCRFEIWFED